MIRVEIPGRIVAKQSVRFTRAGHRYQPGGVTNYHALCAMRGYQSMAGREPLTGACRVCVQIVLQTPASWSKKRKAEHNWCVIRPDLDNALKMLMDGLQGVVFADDKQVVELMMSKRYGTADRAIVTVEPLTAESRAWATQTTEAA